MVDLSLVKPKDLWYAVGLIATDGNLSNDKRHINITSKDGKHMEQVKKALFLTNKLTLKSRASEKTKNYSFLQFGDVLFYKFLLKIGLTPKKSLTLNQIKVPKKYFADFLRGVIDGDGSIHTWKHPSNGNTQWTLRIFSGSQKFIEWLKTDTEKFFKIQGKIHITERENNNSLYQLKFGKFAAKIIFSECYYNGCLSLKRKYLMALECLQAEDKLSKYGVHTSPGGVTGSHA